MSAIEAKKLLKIQSVREKTKPIFDLALQNDLEYFDINFSKLDETLEFVTKIIKRDFTDFATIPPHGRWNHLNAGGVKRVEALVEQWSQYDELEVGRKLIDLVLFSVLIDAGAGNEWKYKEIETGELFSRSEGLAIVSFDLFKQGILSDDPSDPYKISAQKLIEFDEKKLSAAFQISESNPLAGFHGRLLLIQNLGKSLSSNKEVFGEDGRPGNLIDYLYKNYSNKDNELDLSDLWDVLMASLTSIWPKGRTSIDGISLGDAWPLSTTKTKLGKTEFIDTVIPFHKLTQWLTYSLLEPLKNYGYKFNIKNADLLTGLPEYRNGGLFYDFGVIQLKPEQLKRGIEFAKKTGSSTPNIASFEPSDGVIVEWRSITIGLLDYILPLVNKELQATLSLPQLIEAGSWKAGREIAGVKRPETKGPPIDLYSDGTVF